MRIVNYRRVKTLGKLIGKDPLSGQPGLFTEPFSAGGFWRFQGPGRAHSGVPSGIG
jgi:hypothetical protein